jgi:hypothetical protein
MVPFWCRSWSYRLELLDLVDDAFRMVDTNETHDTTSGADRTQEVSGSSPLSSIPAIPLGIRDQSTSAGGAARRPQCV